MEEAKKRLKRLFPTINFGPNATSPVVIGNSGNPLTVRAFKWNSIVLPETATTVYLYESSGTIVRFAYE